MNWLEGLSPGAQVAAITVFGVLVTALFTFLGTILTFLSRWRDRRHAERLKEIELRVRQYEWLINQRTKDAEILMKEVNHFHKLAVGHLAALTEIHSQTSSFFRGEMPTRATRFGGNSRVVIEVTVDTDNRAQPDWFYNSVQELSRLAIRIAQDKQLTASWFRSDAALYWTWFPSRKHISTNLGELDTWFEQFYSSLDTQLKHTENVYQKAPKLFEEDMSNEKDRELRSKFISEVQNIERQEFSRNFLAGFNKRLLDFQDSLNRFLS